MNRSNDQISIETSFNLCYNKSAGAGFLPCTTKNSTYKGVFPMRHRTTLSRRAAAFILVLLLSMPAVHADAGERKLQTTTQIVNGLTYRNTITGNGSSRIESYSLELAPNSAARPILVQGNVTIYGTGTIKKAISNAQAAGWHVLGAVNTDFFSMSNGVPIGIVVEDGIFKSGNKVENILALNNGQAAILDNTQVDITLYNKNSDYMLQPNQFNKARHEIGGIFLFNEYFSGVSTRSSGSGWYVRMKVVDDPASSTAPKLTVNSTLTLQVTELITSDQPIVIGPGEYILTADDKSNRADAFSHFQVDDTVTLTTACSDPTLSSAQWACGVGDIMVRNGALTSSSGWTYANDGRQPRTAVGIKADGTMLLYAVDGRQSGHSVGLTQRDLALELQAQGCVTAANLDGGGSTALSLWMPGQNGPTLQSKPSGNSLRGCATYLLLVTDQPGSGLPQRLAPEETGLTALTGSSLVLPQGIIIDEALNPLSDSISGLTYTSLSGLGVINGGSYTAGPIPGTDTVTLASGSLEGSLQIHVVDQLTDLNVTRLGSSSSLTSLSMKPGESVQLAVTGSYWGREALRDFGPVTATVQGDIGYIDGSGLFTASQNGSKGSITLSAGGLSRTITVSTSGIHQDVTPDHWSHEAVEYCYSKGIVNGISPTLFGRDLPISRADFIVMLHNAKGKPAASGPSTFDDVPQDAYYAPAIAWAQEVGLASGMGGNSFAPTANISREQAFSLLYRFLPLIGKTFSDGSLDYLAQFRDRDSIADYARVPAATLAAYGLASGSSASLSPKGTLTRAEMASLLYRTLELDTSSGQLEIPVPYEKRLLALDQTQVTLASGGSVTLNASLLPALEDAVFNWSSSDPSTAAVSANGMVTNLYPGSKSRNVTITAEWNGLTAKCTVTCLPAAHVGTVVNVETGLNVRSGPGTTYARIGALRNSSPVVVLGQEGDWYQILFLNPDRQAAIGYVLSDYLSLNW